ncbi:MAG TPA: aminoglycoside 6'-N-acetyltransferase [Gemmatimonadaceae bacterium]|nr:aminoglycoside 6'-N-acetyltransferase [Gemmatimonadaceae bacterium]
MTAAPSKNNDRYANLVVRPAQRADADQWAEMRHALWPHGTVAHHRAEIDKYFDGTLHMVPMVLIATSAAGKPIGFAELSIRPYAEGCDTDRVAFLEGWYVVDDARRRGVGGALVSAAEAWGREQGCTEFASDALADNELSQRAHLALGFEETEVIRCFKKVLA